MVSENYNILMRCPTIILFLLILFGCQEEKQPAKYIYYDKVRETIHCDRQCKKLNKPHVTRTERVEIEGIVDWRDQDAENTIIQEFCPICVSDEDYDFIIKAIQDQIFEKYDSIY